MYQEEGLTNNQAEYKAIIMVLQDIEEDNLVIYSDSQLVVNQLNHKWNINEDHLRELATKV